MKGGWKEGGGGPKKKENAQDGNGKGGGVGFQIQRSQQWHAR